MERAAQPLRRNEKKKKKKWQVEALNIRIFFKSETVFISSIDI